jgi:hypothetical protein
MAGMDYAAATDHVARADPLLPSRIDRAVIAVVRVGVGLLWLHYVGWKTPPDFGQGEASDRALSVRQLRRLP